MPNQVAKFALKGDITAEDLHNLLDRVLELHGCPSCGFLGFDAHLLGPDPVEERFGRGRFEGIGGIKSISVTAR